MKKNKERAELETLARKKWASSGLTEAHAKKLHLRPLTEEQVEKLGIEPAWAGLHLPYFDEEGHETEFCRVRFFDERRTGFAAQALKPQRYGQRAGTLNEIYMPPLLDRPWAEFLADTRERLIITEGELKAASACAHGFPTLGLGGVDVWRASTRGLAMLPALAHAKWRDRDVVVLFDSDLEANPHVLRAQTQLARALADRGAKVKVMMVPEGGGGAKQGLDDFIVANSADAVPDMLAEAETPDEILALQEMNADVVYIHNPGLVVEQERLFIMRPDAFTAHHYSNRHFVRVMEKSRKEISTAAVWLDWANRNQVDRLTYAPGAESFVERPSGRADLSDRCFNMWRGWGVEPKKGDAGPWHRLLDHLFSGADAKHRVWFERWCAYPMQRPGAKLFTAAVLWGVCTGTGKSFVGDLLRDIYGANAALIGGDTLESQFNSILANKQFIHGDEITGDDNRKHADRLKNRIAHESMTINEKFKPAYEIETCTNYYFTSNHPDAFFLEDEDRRYFIHQVTANKAPDAFYEALRDWRFGGGPRALFHHLLNLDLGDFNPRSAAPMTEAKEEMIRSGKSDVARWVQALRESGAAQSLKPDCDLFTPSEIFKAYDPEGRGKVTENRVGIELTRARLEKRRVRVRSESLRLWAVRNRETWANRSDREWIRHREEHGPKPSQAKY
jgi:hypothetical protein